MLRTIPCFWFEKYTGDDKTRIRNPVGEGSLRTGEDDRCCLGQTGLETVYGSRSVCGTLERDLTGATDGGVLSIRVRVDLMGKGEFTSEKEHTMLGHSV